MHHGFLSHALSTAAECIHAGRSHCFIIDGVPKAGISIQKEFVHLSGVCLFPKMLTVTMIFL